jgi:phenylalanyl-tRNA synthetase beta chain
MLCSAKELGLSDDASGLLALDTAAPNGTDLRAALALDDAVLTLKLTPNRADCLSLSGIAREVAAATGARLSLPVVAPVPVTIDAVRAVRIEDAAACPRFVARSIDGIDRTPHRPGVDEGAPRAERPPLDLGRSGHHQLRDAGDGPAAARLRRPAARRRVVVRFAREGETLTLLNGQVLTLDADLLMVCDEKKPLGLAGIMGGEHSGIADDTTRVYLEGAFWNPAVIQGKMKRLGLRQ